MLRVLRWSGLMLVALTAAACATMNVSSHAERGRDFSQYRTWAWGEADRLPASDARFDDALVRDHLMGAVERGFGRRGLELGDTLLKVCAAVTTKVGCLGGRYRHTADEHAGRGEQRHATGRL